ncbi:MAG: hypothetical protein M1831_000291 [Alyxoria varia]|nr:MAG: hypothetical protein M1831_000291 [Alyxoria varia]
MNNFNPSQPRPGMAPHGIPQQGMAQPPPNQSQDQNIMQQIFSFVQQNPVNPQIAPLNSRVAVIRQLYSSQKLIQGDDPAKQRSVLNWALNVERRLVASAQSYQDYSTGVQNHLRALHTQRQNLNAMNTTSFPSNGMPAQAAPVPPSQNTLAQHPEQAQGSGRGHPNQSRPGMLSGQPAAQFGNLQQTSGTPRPPQPANSANQPQPSTPAQPVPQQTPQAPQPNNPPNQSKPGQQVSSQKMTLKTIFERDPEKAKQNIEQAYRTLLNQQLKRYECNSLEQLKAKMNIPPQHRVEAQRLGMDPLVHSLQQAARAAAAQKLQKEHEASGKLGEPVQSNHPSASQMAKNIDYTAYFAAQDSAKRSAEAGDLVVPASDNQSFQRNVNNRNVGGPAFGNSASNAGGSTNAFQAQSRQFPSQPGLQRQNTSNSSDQITAKGLPPRPASTTVPQASQPRPTSAAMLQGQSGGLYVGQQNQQPSPAMPVLNKPFQGAEQTPATPQRPPTQGVQRSQQASPQPGVGTSQSSNQEGPRNPPSFGSGMNPPSTQNPQNQAQLLEQLLNTMGPKAFAARQLPPQYQQILASQMKSEEHGKQIIRNLIQRFSRPNSQLAQPVADPVTQNPNASAGANGQTDAPATQASLPTGPVGNSAAGPSQGAALIKEIAEQPFPRNVMAQRLPSLRIPDNLRSWGQVAEWMSQNRSNFDQDVPDQLLRLARDHWTHINSNMKNPAAEPIQNNNGQRLLPPHVVQSSQAFQKGLVQIAPNGEVEIKPPTQQEIQQFQMSHPDAPPPSVPNLVQRTKLEHLKATDMNLARVVLQRYTQQLQQRQNEPRMQDSAPVSAPQQGSQAPQQNPTPFAGMAPGGVPAGMGRGQQTVVPGSNMVMQPPPRFPPGTAPYSNGMQPNQTQMLPPSAQHHFFPGPQPQPPQARPTLGPQGAMNAQVSTLPQAGAPPMTMSNGQVMALDQAQSQINQVNGQSSGKPADAVENRIQFLLQRLPTGQKVEMEPAQFNQIREKFGHFLTYQRDFRNAFKLAFESKGGFDDELNAILQFFAMLLKQSNNDQFEPRLSAPDLMNLLERIFRWAKQQSSKQNVSKPPVPASTAPSQNHVSTASAEPVKPSAQATTAKSSHTKQAPSMEKKTSTKKASAKAPPAPTSSQPPQTFPNPDTTTGHPKTGDGRPKYAESRSEFSFSPDNLSIPEKKRKKPNRVGEVVAQTPPAPTPGSTGSPQPAIVSKQDTMPATTHQDPPVAPKKPMPFRCPVAFCDADVEGFESSDQLNDHLDKEHGGASGPFGCIQGTEQDVLPEVGLQTTSHRVTMEDSATGSTRRPADAADQEDSDSPAKRQKGDDRGRYFRRTPIAGERQELTYDDSIQQMIEDAVHGVDPLDAFMDAVWVGQGEAPGSTTKTPGLTPDDHTSDGEEEDMTGFSEEEKRRRRRENMSIEELYGPETVLTPFVEGTMKPGPHWGPTGQPSAVHLEWYENEKKFHTEREQEARMRKAREAKARKDAAEIAAAKAAISGRK